MNNKLVFTSTTLTDADIYGGIQFSQDINPDENLQYGNVSIPELKFTIDYTNSSGYLNQQFTWQCKMMDEASYTTKGVFKVKNITKKKNKAEITAYDKLIVIDRVVDTWLNGLTFPITINSMFQSLCTYLGITGATITNEQHGNFTITTKNFTGTNITGRQMLQYIAAACFCNAVPDSTYDIKMIRYNPTQAIVKAFTNADYSSVDLDTPNAAQITGVQIQSTNSDVGYIAGTPNYVVTDNPIYYSADSASQTAIQAIATAETATLGAISYKPIKMSVFKDHGVNVGDRITVDGQITYVMKKKITSSGVEFESTGSTTRLISTDETNHQIQVLKNQTNELTNTVSEHTRTLTTQGESISTLSQRSDQISASVTALDNSIESRIDVSLDGLTLSYDNSGVTGDNSCYITLSKDGVDIGGTVKMTNVTVDSISASKITAGTLDADNIGVKDQFAVKRLVTPTTGDPYYETVGYIGAANGNDGQSTTYGAKLTSANGDNYVIVTNAGTRLQVGNTSLWLENNHIRYSINGGTTTELGYAVFS